MALVLVHELVGPIEDHVAIGIGRRVEGGKALRQGKAVLIAVQPLHPLRYIAKAALKDDGELVPADTVRMPFGEALPQRMGDGADNFIAALVAEAVVDILEAVEIKDRDGKGRRAVPDRVVKAVDMLLIGCAIAEPGQAVDVGAGADESDLFAEPLLQGVDPAAEALDIVGAARLLRSPGRFGRAGRYLVHKGFDPVGDEVHLPEEVTEAPAIAHDDQGDRRGRSNQRQAADAQRDADLAGNLRVIPVGGEVDGDDAADLTLGVKDRGIGAVEAAPLVCIGLPIHAGGAEAGPTRASVVAIWSPKAPGDSGSGSMVKMKAPSGMARTQ